jgi:hypothetical protein
MKIETLKHDYEPLVPILKRSNTRNMIQKDKYLFLYTKEPEKLLLSIISYLKTTNDQLLSIEVSKPSIEEVFEAATKR